MGIEKFSAYEKMYAWAHGFIIFENELYFKKNKLTVSEYNHGKYCDFVLLRNKDDSFVCWRAHHRLGGPGDTIVTITEKPNEKQFIKVRYLG